MNIERREVRALRERAEAANAGEPVFLHDPPIPMVNLNGLILFLKYIFFFRFHFLLHRKVMSAKHWGKRWELILLNFKCSTNVLSIFSEKGCHSLLALHQSVLQCRLSKRFWKKSHICYPPTTVMMMMMMNSSVHKLQFPILFHQAFPLLPPHLCHCISLPLTFLSRNEFFDFLKIRLCLCI